jgi:hypothetical protein
MRPYKDDIDNISSAWKVAYFFGCLATYCVFMLFSENGAALAAAGSVASIVLVARVRWNLREFTWFWLFLAVAVAIHVLVVVALNRAIEVHPTIILAPLGIADFAILLWSLSYLERLLAP